MQRQRQSKSPLLKYAEVATWLNVGVSTVRNLVLAGRLNKIRAACGKGFRIHPSEVERFIKESTEAEPDSAETKSRRRAQPRSKHFKL